MMDNDFALPASDDQDFVEQRSMNGIPMEEYREIKCSFSVTIRRDAWGVPVAIMGQWIVSHKNASATQCLAA